MTSPAVSPGPCSQCRFWYDLLQKVVVLVQARSAVRTARIWCQPMSGTSLFPGTGALLARDKSTGQVHILDLDQY